MKNLIKISLIVGLIISLPIAIINGAIEGVKNLIKVFLKDIQK